MGLASFIAQKEADHAEKKAAHDQLKAQEKVRHQAELADAHQRKFAAQHQELFQTCMREEFSRWGPAPQGQAEVDGKSTRAIVARYQRTVGVSPPHQIRQGHAEKLTQVANALKIDHLADPVNNKHYLDQLRSGYFEPVPVAWAQSTYNPLTGPPLHSKTFSTQNFEDAAEERLYWALNNAITRDYLGNVMPKQQRMRPDEFHELKMAHQRIKSAMPIDTRFQSDGDHFLGHPEHRRLGYSKQVPPMRISHAFQDLFQRQMMARAQGGQGHGTDEVDVMVLIDVSSSMGWDHPAQFQQPRHVDVVRNIFHRAVHHMEVRDSYASMGGAGVETVCFNSVGQSIGKVNWGNFNQQWNRIEQMVYSGGGTVVMKGWNLIKDLHFRKHGGNGRAWYDPQFGWQATTMMAKLSLLVMLDGEAFDMDEFEIELLSEKWCYVTICLIGRENCPEHHRHANELTRIANANDHINFLDIHGRICERLVVSDILQRVYASNAPSYDEIMSSQYDLPPPTYRPYQPY